MIAEEIAHYLKNKNRGLSDEDVVCIQARNEFLVQVSLDSAVVSGCWSCDERTSQESLTQFSRFLEQTFKEEGGDERAEESFKKVIRNPNFPSCDQYKAKNKVMKPTEMTPLVWTFIDGSFRVAANVIPYARVWTQAENVCIEIVAYVRYNWSGGSHKRFPRMFTLGLEGKTSLKQQQQLDLVLQSIPHIEQHESPVSIEESSSHEVGRSLSGEFRPQVTVSGTGGGGSFGGVSAQLNDKDTEAAVIKHPSVTKKIFVEEYQTIEKNKVNWLCKVDYYIASNEQAKIKDPNPVDRNSRMKHIMYEASKEVFVNLGVWECSKDVKTIEFFFTGEVEVLEHHWMHRSKWNVESRMKNKASMTIKL